MKRHLYLVRDFSPLNEEDQERVLRECQVAVRDWIVTTHGSPDRPDSVKWWHENISFLDRQRMDDWDVMGDAVGVACEGISGWTNWCASDLHNEWHDKGVYLEPFNGWLLTLYVRVS